jgi:hypothetical protein
MRPHAPLLASALIALVPLVLLGACGGKVVVDAPSGATGVGGAGGAGGQGQGGIIDTGVGGQNTGASCGFPVPVGVLVGCSSAVSVGSSGGPPQCSTARCDSANNLYEADCIGDSCTCTYNPAVGTGVQCSCALAGSCSLGGADCCGFAH